MKLARAVGLPTVLLLLVAATHYGYDVIGARYVGREIAASTAWFGVLRAIEATVLYLTVWWLVPWQPVATRYAAALVCLWGALESAQIAVCRLQFDMTQRPPDPKLYSGLCDLITGWPVYMLSCLAVLIVALARHGAARRG